MLYQRNLYEYRYPGKMQAFCFTLGEETRPTAGEVISLGCEPEKTKAQGPLPTALFPPSPIFGILLILLPNLFPFTDNTLRLCRKNRRNLKHGVGTL